MQPGDVRSRSIGVLSFANARAHISPETLANNARSMGIAAFTIPAAGGNLPPGKLALRLFRLIEALAGSARVNEAVTLSDKECERIREDVAREALDVLLSPVPIVNVCSLATRLGVPIVYVACAYEHLGSRALEAKLSDLARGDYRPRLDLRMAIPGSDRPHSIRSASSTPISRLSIALNDEPLTSLAPALWNHAIKLLVSGKPEVPAAATPTSPELLRPPRWTLLSTLALLGRHVVHRQRRTGSGESWEVGVRRRSDQEGSHQSGDGYKWLVAPPGCWYADPFVVETNGALLIFVEEFVVDRGKGRIVCLRLNDSLAVEERIAVLERPYHLAYPHVFKHEDAFFMIPESGANGTVEIYRAKTFPGEWEFVRVLHRGPLFDTTVAPHNGSFWFFTSRISDQRGSAAELLLFHSDSLLGDWTPHPLSPLSLDAFIARGGGSIFEHDGALVRPAQDCSRVYGGGVTFHAIEELTKLNFRAIRTGELGMRGKAARMHTYNRSRSFEVIDRVRSD